MIVSGEAVNGIMEMIKAIMAQQAQAEQLGIEADVPKGEEEKLDEAAFGKAVATFYDMTLEQYRPLIDILIPKLLEKGSDDLLAIIKVIPPIFLKVMEDEELAETGEKISKIRAEKRFKIFTTYKDAGFTDEQAMSLMFHDVDNLKSWSDKLSTLRK